MLHSFHLNIFICLFYFYVPLYSFVFKYYSVYIYMYILKILLFFEIKLFDFMFFFSKWCIYIKLIIFNVLSISLRYFVRISILFFKNYL